MEEVHSALVPYHEICKMSLMTQEVRTDGSYIRRTQEYADLVKWHLHLAEQSNTTSIGNLVQRVVTETRFKVDDGRMEQVALVIQPQSLDR